MSYRVMVFGAAGQLGIEIGRVAKRHGFDVKRFDRGELDIIDARGVEEAMAAFDPRFVFNCAAYNQVDVAEAEPQLAYSANALGVRNLAVACRRTTPF